MRDREIYEILAWLSENPLYIRLREEGTLTGMIIIPDDPFVEGIASIDLFKGASYRPDMMVKVMVRLDEHVDALYERLLRGLSKMEEPLVVPNDS